MDGPVGDRKSIICSQVTQLLFIGLMAISMTCGTKHPVKYRAVQRSRPVGRPGTQFHADGSVPGVERVWPHPIKCYTTANNGLKTSRDLNSWARRAVGEGVRSCPRAGCREIRMSGSPTLLSRLAPDTALRTDGSDVAIKSWRCAAGFLAG
jgi:hypothetical protein